MDVIGFRRSKSSGGSGCGSCSNGAVAPRSSSCGMRRSVGSVLGGLGSSSLSGAAARGVEVDAGWPFLELEKEDLVRFMGVWGAAAAADEDGADGAGVAIGERAQGVEPNGEELLAVAADAVLATVLQPVLLIG